MTPSDGCIASRCYIRRIQLVIKISKYCNLRCTYCYEYNELSIKTRMDLGRIDQMFRNVGCALDSGLISEVECIWHGGEPFLIPLEYFSTIGTIQESISGRDCYRNVVQSNLTILTDRHLDFLKNKSFFQSLGISFDVFGNDRVDVSGKSHDAVVLSNIQKLIDHEIDFGAISVLTPGTLPHSRKIQKFWSSLGKDFRFLPFYLSADESQLVRHGLTGPELVTVMTQSFLDWLASKSAVKINPISEYLVYTLGYMAGGARRTYNPKDDEVVFIVNVNGDVVGAGNADSYQRDGIYGNIFDTSLVDILHSSSRMTTMQNSINRMEKHCGLCPYFGYCPGHPVANASALELDLIEKYGCTVRHIMDVFVETLGKSEIAGDITSRLHNAGLEMNIPAGI